MQNILSPCLLCFFSQMPISASVIFFSPVLAIGFFAHGGNGLVEIWLGIFGRSPTRRGALVCFYVGGPRGVLKT